MLDSIKNVLPEMYLSALALIALFRGIIAKDKQRAFNNSFLTIMLALIATGLIYVFWVPKNEVIVAFPVGFKGEYLFTNYNLIINVKILILICAGVLAFLLREDLRRLKDMKFEYNFLLLMSVIGAFIAISSFNLFVIFVGVELLNFCVYILLGSVGKKTRKIKATGRYFVISAIATGVMLYGISLLYLSCQTVGLGGVGVCVAHYSGMLGSIKLFLGLCLLGIGLMMKMGIFPFQYYLPDIAKDTNRTILAVLLTIVKLTFLTIFFHVVIVLGVDKNFLIAGLLIVTVGILVSAFVCYNEENIDRLFSYSSIHNTCFVMCGVMLLDYKLFLYYQVLYMLLILAFICFVSSFKINGKPIKTFKDFALVVSQKPVSKFFGFSILFLISGAPPLGMFFGKFLVVKELIYKEHFFFSFLAALGGVLMIGCFLKIMRNVFVYFTTNNKEVKVISNFMLQVISYILMLSAVCFSFIFLF